MPRKFNGETYRKHSDYARKEAAERFAAVIRRQGGKARVVKIKGGWAIYKA